MKTKKILLAIVSIFYTFLFWGQSSFTPGRLVAVQTTGATSKFGSFVSLKEYTTAGSAGVSVSLPTTGVNVIQMAATLGGSEGFLTQSTNGENLILGGYSTITDYSATDITASSSSTVPRAVYTIDAGGNFAKIYSSTTYYNANDIRGGISDGTNYWVSGAASSTEGINYFGPSTPTTFGAGSNPLRAYGFRIFNGQMYYSTQKAGPSNSSSHLGIFSVGSGLPTSGSPTLTQLIDMGSNTPADFSFNSSTTVCYIAVNSNNSSGGIQKWTKSGSVWTLQYTLGTGVTNIGAFGLVVDYSGGNPVIYATTSESTVGNRIIKIIDSGSGSTATTLVAATTNKWFHGLDFAPVNSVIPTVNLSVSSNTGLEAGTTAITVTATASSTLVNSETISLGVSGTNITAGDYTLSNTTITIPSGSSTGSVTFTVVDDVVSEGSETAILTISNPSQGLLLGNTPTQNVVISDNDNNTAPTILVNVATTSDFIDGSAISSPSSPYTISGSRGDITDPMATLGIDFVVNDAETVVSSLIVTASSSNTSVVPNGNLVLTGTSAIRNLKITPNAVGYSTITVQVSDGLNSASYVISYAASDSIPKIVLANTAWHIGMSDASDAIAIDNDFYMTADDEVDLINVYSRQNSGLPVASFNYASYLNLPDPAKPEVDAEAGTKSYLTPNRFYWLGSMSNGKAPFDNKPNRDRLLATTVTGSGATTSISFSGYSAIKSSLLAWGDAYGYNFTTSANAGVDSKTVSGFAAEGMVFGPDSTTLWIGLRAPLVPTANRTKAVIAPILNFETWFNNGSQSGNPTFGSPIELNLGGKGIRDIIRLQNGTYIIVAGDFGDNVSLSSIYKWTGNSADNPILVQTNGNGKLNMEGVMEIITNDTLSMSKLQVISDGGTEVIYNDGQQAKDFGNLNLRKFRSDILASLDLCMPLVGSIASSETACAGFLNTISAVTVPNESKFVWNTGAVTKSINVTAFGTYTSTTTDKYGCVYNTRLKTISNALAGDINEDGVNDVNDFLLFAPKFNTSCNGCKEDLNKDNVIDINDFLIYAPQFNQMCVIN